MTYTERAIKKAIEGGYEPWRGWFIDEPWDKTECPKPYLIEVGMDGHEDFECPHSIVVFKWDEEEDKTGFVNDDNSTLGFTLSGIYIDPSFWQSLGKALKWRTYDKSTSDKRMINRGMVDQWLREWHRFIDHLAEGKTAEEYFAQLLK